MIEEPINIVVGGLISGAARFALEQLKKFFESEKCNNKSEKLITKKRKKKIKQIMK